MLEFKNQDIRDKILKFHGDYAKGLQTILMYDKFMSRTLKDAYAKDTASGIIKFPMKIRIAPSIPEMLKGNFEPAQEFILNEPIMFGDVPIWWGSSLKGINIRLGFKNGDSRKPCRAKFNDKDIHGLLAGVTGMGKSVTLNILIFGVAFEYAPWEVQMTTLDAKAADIKKFGQYPLPHINAVAATTDTDYILSVLNAYYADMRQRQAVFGKKGVNNIEDFRKVTGLILPRILLPFDEFIACLTNAGKNANKVADFIDQFARLGRSAGYHLLLASQEFGGALPDNTLNNIGVRMCLGANEKVSEKVLGNPEANTIQVKGKVLLNTTPGNHKAEENQRFQVPFQPSDGTDSQFVTQVTFLKALGKDFGYDSIPDFYDEASAVFEKDFPAFISRFHDPSKIYLGEPSFVMQDTEKVVSIKYTSADIENMLIIVSAQEDLARYGKMIKYNLERQNSGSLAFVADQLLYNRLEYSTNAFACSQFLEDNVQNYLTFISLRLALLDIDNAVKENYKTSTEIDALMVEKYGTSSPFYSKTNRCRAYYAYEFSTTKYADAFGTKRVTGKLSQNDMLIVYKILGMYQSYNSLDSMLTVSKIPPIYYWIVGLQNLRGIGRVGKIPQIDQLKNLMFDCCKVNIRFIILGTNVDESYELARACRYIILDKPTSKVIGNLKIGDYYPSIVPDNLAVLVDIIKQESFKFKKMKYDNEY